MLRFLAIRRLAVIDALDVEFQPGFNVLTGETGAGKSMLVEAVGLLVGGRASPDLVRTGEETSTVQAVFEEADGREIVVRREIATTGRSRAFVDDTLCTSASLRERCGNLVDLHGQHEHQRLLDPATHVELVDEHARLSRERAEVADAYRRWKALRDEADQLYRADRDKASRLDLIAFQLAEIEKVDPLPGEDEQLAATRNVLANADKLSRLCADAYESLYEGEQAALAALASSWRKVAELAALDPRFQPYVDARDTIKSQLEDLAYFLRSYSADIDASPGRLQEVEDRLAAIERLKRKHGGTLQAVLDRGKALTRERELMQTSVERLARVQEELAEARDRFVAAARSLSSARAAHGERLCRAIERALGELAMPRTRCEFRLTVHQAEDQWTESGMDAGEFFLSPNPGEDVRPLVRIASGGELSRVMLALKTLAATDSPGKTLIFDEVDAGIGGAVADVVGAKLRALSDRYQVLCITHLPQIAAYGASHYRIDKSVRHGRTVTSVTAVSGMAREEELARMIGGADIGAAMLASARAMLSARHNAPPKRRNRQESI